MSRCWFLALSLLGEYFVSLVPWFLFPLKIFGEWDGWVLSVFLACSDGVFTESAYWCWCLGSWEELGRKVGEYVCDSLGMRAERKGRPQHFPSTELEVGLGMGEGNWISGSVGEVWVWFSLLVSLERSVHGLAGYACWSWDLEHSDKLGDRSWGWGMNCRIHRRCGQGWEGYSWYCVVVLGMRTRDKIWGNRERGGRGSVGSSLGFLASRRFPDAYSELLHSFNW